MSNSASFMIDLRKPGLSYTAWIAANEFHVTDRHRIYMGPETHRAFEIELYGGGFGYIIRQGIQSIGVVPVKVLAGIAPTIVIIMQAITADGFRANIPVLDAWVSWMFGNGSEIDERHRRLLDPVFYERKIGPRDREIRKLESWRRSFGPIRPGNV